MIDDFAYQQNLIATPNRVVENANTLATAATTTGVTVTAATTPAPTTTGTPTATAASAVAPTDFRVRIGHLAGYSNPYPGIQAPLAATSGLMFPYTPSIQVGRDVSYSEMSMVHSNTDYHSYARTPNASFNITGKFTVQNQNEGKYVLAVIHFLRSVSLMYFGEQDGANAGTPPPILQFSGYGPYVFNKVRVYMKNHSFSFDENMDMVPVKTDAGVVRLPALFSISVTIVAQPTPRAMRKDFSLEAYRSGKLLEDGKGFY